MVASGRSVVSKSRDLLVCQQTQALDVLRANLAVKRDQSHSS